MDLEMQEDSMAHTSQEDDFPMLLALLVELHPNYFILLKREYRVEMQTKN